MTLTPAVTATPTQSANPGLEEVSGGDLLVVAVIIGVTVVFVLGVRHLMRYAVRTLARRALAGKSSRWRVRAPRLTWETVEQAEVRRLQRVDATASVTARLAALIWCVLATMLILNQLGINAALAVGAAGFVGAGVAIGGQHSIHDFVNGLHILFEDRLGEGDRIEVTIDGTLVEATVISLGAFAARVETDRGVVHVANRALSTVTNLSQHSAPHCSHAATSSTNGAPEADPRTAPGLG